MPTRAGPLSVVMQAAMLLQAAPVHYSLTADGYFAMPSGRGKAGVNPVRAFDTIAWRPVLNLAQISVAASESRIGFQFDAGGGKSYGILHQSDPSGSRLNRQISQAYLRVKPPQTRGLTIEYGKFATSTGFETFRAIDNWNYSRSLVFTWAQPSYHFGWRASIPAGHGLLLGVQHVNGWNRIGNNRESKTIGATASWTGGAWSWAGTVYSGPQRSGAGVRRLYDAVIGWSPRKATSILANIDYGCEYRARWDGWSIAARQELSRKLYLSPRGSWFRDHDAVMTGTRQRLSEFSFTVGWRLSEMTELKPEARLDSSSLPVFSRGRREASFLVALVASVGKRQ